MCEKCNRLVAAIQFEINIIEGVLKDYEDIEHASGTAVFICYETVYYTLKNILDNLDNGRGT